MKNLINLIKKYGRKSGNLIDKKPQKLDEKTRKKINYLLFYSR